jgi:O-antigen ligase
MVSVARLSLGAAIFFAPFRYRWSLFTQNVPRVWGDYTSGLIFLHDVFVVATLLFWSASLILQRRRISFGPLALALPLAGLLTVSLVSALLSIDIRISVYHWIQMLLAAGLYLFVVNEIKSLGVLIWGVAGGLLVQSAVGITQVLAQHDLGLQLWGEYELDPSWRGVSIVWAEGVRSLRAYGLSDHPNILGGLLAFSLVLLGSWIVAAESKLRTIATGIFALGSVGLLLTFSRSAWVALAVGFALMVGLMVWRKQKLALERSFALVLSAAIIAVPFIWANLAYLGVRLNRGGSFEEVNAEMRSLSERARLNQYANQIFAANALNGVGLGTFPLALRQVEPELTFDYQPPHVVLLHAAAETGLFGAFFYVSAAMAPWLLMWFRRKRLVFGPALIGSSAVLLAVTVVGFFDYYPWLLAPGRFWHWLAWGLWAASYQNPPPEA